MTRATWRVTVSVLMAGAVLGGVPEGAAQEGPEASPGARVASGGRGGDLVVGGNLIMVDSDPTRGNIVKNGRVFLHERGPANIGLGQESLESMQTEGGNNLALGAGALRATTTGVANVALGVATLEVLGDGQGNVGIGMQSLGQLAAGNDNVAIGLLAGVSLVAGSNNIYIGTSFGDANESDTIRIGSGTTAVFVDGIHGNELDVDSDHVGVAGPDGRLGRIPLPSSSGRFKTAVATLDPGTDLVGRLRPVTFRYRPGHGDGGRTLRYGLIAEEVAEIAPELVRLDAEERPLTVRYEAVPILLLAEAQRQRARLDAERAELEAQRRQLQTQARDLQAQRQALDALQARLAALEAAAQGPGAP